MLAYVFPPFYSEGGSIRVVKFIKYLPALGWLPMVLTIDDRSEYESMRRVGSEALLKDIPQQVTIFRTASGERSLESLGKERDLGERNLLVGLILGVVSAARRWAFRSLCLPDRYLTWMPFALRRGRQIVESEGADIIFATCPPHSVALVGAILKRITGKPLVLDFRDDWIDTPRHRSKPRLVRWIEERMERWAVETCDRLLLVTEWSKNAFVNRYPGEAEEKFVFIPNGCDLEDFAEVRGTSEQPRVSEFTIVHAGQLSEAKIWRRNPEAFFLAVDHLRRKYPELANDLTVAFTSPLQEGYRRVVRDLDLSGVVKEVGHLPREKLVRFMKSADLLLAVNYDGFSTLIPGKIYEYWAVGGPPILLLSCQGAAQSLVEENHIGIVVQADDVEAIEGAVLHAYRQRKAGHPMRISYVGVERYDRKILTERLADTLRAVVDLK